MPLTVVTARPGLLSEKAWDSISAYLQILIARSLNAPDDEGGKLTPDDIEIRYREIGPRDRNAAPFMVEVYANEFPSRKENLTERTLLIAAGIRTHPDVPSEVIGKDKPAYERGFVWVQLAPAGFEML